MTPAWNRAVGYMFCLAAIACPLDLLQFIPWLGISLLSLIALLLIPPLLLDAIAQQKLRVPFEVLAPAALVLALTGLDAALHGPRETLGEVVSGLILFVTVTHFAPPRDLIRRYVFAFVLSGFAVTLVTLVARLADVVPTAFSLRSGVTFTFAYSIASGVHILLLIATAAFYVARERRFSPIERAIATGSIVFLACGLVATAIHWTYDTRALPIAAYPPMTYIRLAAALVAVWTLARILGKVVVNGRSDCDPLHGLWISAAAVTLAVCAMAPVPPAAYQGYLAGLACGSVLPSQFLFRPSRRAWALAAIPVVLAAANLAVVFTGNTRDHRQYDAASMRDFEAGRYERLLMRLDTIDRHAPDELRTHLWRARTALALGLPNWASFEYAQSAGPFASRLLLPPPTPAERQDFVVQMRDAVAAMPESQSVCAFERALIAEDNRDSALYSMRLETAVALIHVETVDTAPFAAAVARVVGDTSLTDELQHWSAEELVTLMTYWGATLEETNDGPALVLVAQRYLDGLDVLVYTDDRTELFHRDLAAPVAADVDALLAAGALRWSEPAIEPGVTRYTLTLEMESAVLVVGEIELRQGGSVRFTLADPVPAIPFTPAIRLRLAP